MKNYYEILEVDKHASIEVIDKAYKVLAKKYHPDINSEDKKAWAEEQFKKINQAYEVLSDESKRKDYDQELKASTIDYSKKYEELCKKQEILKQELQSLKNRYKSSYNHSVNTQPQKQPKYNTYSKVSTTNNSYYKNNMNFEPNTEDIRKEEFHRTYRNILHSLGFSICEKKTFKDFLAFVFTILLIVFIIFVLWNIPFTQNYLISFYENNEILKGIVNFFNR